MTADTVGALGEPGRVGGHFVNGFAVAIDATRVEHADAARDHFDGLMKVLERERLGVAEAGVGLHDVLGYQGVRRMAVVARGDMMMTRPLPRVVVVFHDVAVRTRRGIVREVARTLGVVKRICPGAEDRGEGEAGKSHNKLWREYGLQRVGSRRFNPGQH